MSVTPIRINCTRSYPHCRPRWEDATEALHSAPSISVAYNPAPQINGKTGLLDYLQLLSGPDQVQWPYNTSYPTCFIALPSRAVLLGSHRLMICCLLFRCPMALANHY